MDHSFPKKISPRGPSSRRNTTGETDETSEQSNANLPRIDITDVSEGGLSKSRSSDFTPHVSSDGMFHDAAARLHRTISTIKAPEFPVSRALSYMLEEVQKNDSVDAEGLLLKLQQRRDSVRRKTSSIQMFSQNFDSDLKKLLSAGPQANRKASYRPCDDTITTVTEEDEDEEGGQIQNIAKYFSALEKVDLEAFENLIGSATLKDNFELLADYFLDNVQHEWGKLFDIIVPMKQIHSMVVIGVVQFLTVNGVLSQVPAVLSYVSFFFCIYYTLKTLHNRQSLNDFVAWKKLLGIFANEKPEDTSNVEISRKKSVLLPAQPPGNIEVAQPFSTPYLKFIIAILLFVFGFAMSGMARMNASTTTTNREAMPHSSNVFSVFALSCLCTMLCSWSSLDMKNLVLKMTAIFALFGMVMPKILHKFGLHNILKPLWCNCMPLVPDVFIFRFDPFSICFLVASTVYICVFWKNVSWDNWISHWHQILAPHLMCLIWWQLSLTLMAVTDFSALEKTDLMLAISMASLLLYPKLGLAAVVLTLICGQWYKHIGFSAMFKFAFSLALLVVPVFAGRIIGYFLSTKQPAEEGENENRKISSGDIRKKKNILLVFYVILVVASATFLYEGRLRFWTVPLNRNGRSTLEFTWTDYKTHCLKGSTTKQDASAKPRLVRQIFCSDLRGLDVSWSGRVRSVEISKVDNFFHFIFAFLPDLVSDWLTCFYGRPIDDERVAPTDHKNLERPFAVRNCTLMQHNVYTFRVEVEPTERESGDVIFLTAGDTFKEVIFELSIGDEVSFGAKFDTDFTAKKPLVLKLTRLDRPTTDEQMAQVNRGSLHAHHNDFWGRLPDSVHFLLNFIFSPLLSLSVM